MRVGLWSGEPPRNTPVGTHFSSVQNSDGYGVKESLKRKGIPDHWTSVGRRVANRFGSPKGQAVSCSAL